MRSQNIEYALRLFLALILFKIISAQPPITSSYDLSETETKDPTADSSYETTENHITRISESYDLSTPSSSSRPTIETNLSNSSLSSSLPTSISPTFSTTPKPIRSSSPFFCPCDYHLTSCDFNCCCDPDCSEEIKPIFSTCEDEESYEKLLSLRNSRSCYKKDYLLRNNLRYKTTVAKSGLVCVISDNLNQLEEFLDVKVNISRISNDAKSKYFWDAGASIYYDTVEEHKFNHSYKFGNKIQLVKSTGKTLTRIHMGIPSAIYDAKCTAKTPVTFLESTVSKCHFKTSKISTTCKTAEILNVETFLKDVFVLGNPTLNHSNENLINFTYLLCSQDPSSPCMEVKKLERPNYNENTSTCVNILGNLDIIFFHNGLAGIVHVMAHIYYTNYSISTTKIFQRFTTNFKWDNQDDDNIHPHTIREWSDGSPGYNIGNPVLVGVPIQNKSDIVVLPNQTKEEKEILARLMVTRKMIMNPKDVKPLTVLSPNGCDGERKSVLFGYDVSANCYINYSNVSSCESLQRQIGEILLGVSPKNFKNRYVAAFEHPDMTSSSHWIPILTSEDPIGLEESGSSFKLINGCEGLITSLHIQILYAYVGSIYFPQLRIKGVLFRFGESTNIPQKEKSDSDMELLITTTTKFTDITPSPVTPLPKWPIISIKLPSDFFYPFSIVSSIAGASISKISIFPLNIFAILVRFLA